MARDQYRPMVGLIAIQMVFWTPKPKPSWPPPIGRPRHHRCGSWAPGSVANSALSHVRLNVAADLAEQGPASKGRVGQVCPRRRRCLYVDARIQEQRDANSRNQQPRRVSPEMASKPRDMCHGALPRQCLLLTW
jgi:hypothetical protein